MPIKYTKLIALMQKKGVTSYTLKRDKVIGQATYKKIMEGGDIDTRTIAKLCELLNCQPGDILEYVSDGTVANENTPINKQPVISDDIIQTRAKEDRAVQTAPPKARTRREISDSQLMEIANRLKNEKQDNTIKPLDNS